MYPILWQWGDFVLPAWHSFFVLGALLAYQVFFLLHRRFYPELCAAKLSWFYIWSYLGAYLGARLLSIFMDQPEVTGARAMLQQMVSLGPMTFYGGFLGAACAGVLYCWWARLASRKVFDLALPAGLTGLAIGRIGCFLNGDDYGISLQLAAGSQPPWWAVQFADQVWRVPVQLIESLGVACIVALSIRFFAFLKDELGPMSVGLFALQLFCILRFADEFLRGDQRGRIMTDQLSPAQFFSLLVLFVSFWALYQLCRMRQESTRSEGA